MSLFDASETDDFSDEEEDSKIRSENEDLEETEEYKKEGNDEDGDEDEEESLSGSGTDASDLVDENDNVRKNVKKEKMPLQITNQVIEKDNTRKNAKKEKVIQNKISVIPTEQLKVNKKLNKKQEVETLEEPEKKKKMSPKNPGNLVAGPKRQSTQVMVDQALTVLNERMGSSIVAIKKYIVTHFSNFDENRIKTFIAKYLKKSVEEGKIKQTNRKFKLIANKKKKPVKTSTRTTVVIKNAPENARSTKKVSNPKDKIVFKPIKGMEPSTSADALKAQKSKKTIKSTESNAPLNMAPKQQKNKKVPNTDMDSKVPKKITKKENTELISKTEANATASVEKPSSKQNSKKAKSQKTKN